MKKPSFLSKIVLLLVFASSVNTSLALAQTSSTVIIKNKYLNGEGYNVTVDGSTRPSPYTTSWAFGTFHTIAASDNFHLGNYDYYFQYWKEVETNTYSYMSTWSDYLPTLSQHTFVAYFRGGPYEVQVISPTAGTVWRVGQYVDITWNAPAGLENTTKIDIALSRDSGASFENIVNGLPHSSGGTGKYTWQVIGPASPNCIIRVHAVDDFFNNSTAFSSLFTIIDYPEIVLNPTVFDFTGAEGGNNPPDQILNITNGGGGILDWSASHTQSWLTVTPTSGIAPSSVALSVNLSGLSSGTYSDIIAVSAPATNSPQEIAVNLIVSPYSNLFAPVENYPAPTKPVCIFAANLNEDGYEDLAVSKTYSSGYQGFSVLKNDGKGGFGPQVLYGGADFRSITGADFDLDGDIDLVAVDFCFIQGQICPDYAYLYRNDGMGNFTYSSRYFGGTFLIWVTAANLNGDAYPDLAVLSSSSFLYVLLNDGQGGFYPMTYYTVDPAGQGLSHLFAADLDGDGDQDLAVARTGYSDDICVLKNDGNGVFTLEANYYKVGDEPKSIFASDLLDNDGDLDLVVASSGAEDISILRNNGSGVFEPAGQYSMQGYGPKSVCATDLDGDTDKDIVVSARYGNSGKLFVFVNKGDNTFAPLPPFPVGSYPECVIAADFDRDGDNDIAVANAGSGNISVLENLTGYVRGDANGDGGVTLSDVVYLINYLFKGGPAPTNTNAADPNGDCKISLSDIVRLINYLFKGGPAPLQGCAE